MRGLRFLAAALCVGAWVGAAAAEQTLDGIVARVDQSVVTWSQVLQEREILAASGAAAGTAEPHAVAETLIQRRLLVAEAQKMRIDVSAEDVGAEARALSTAGGDAAAFWERVGKLGVTEDDLRRRCRDVLLTRRYLALREEMTFVPEAEVREYYAAQGDAYKGRPLFQVRDEVRGILSKRKYEQELSQWFVRQVEEGRVRYFGAPGGAAGEASR